MDTSTTPNNHRHSSPPPPPPPAAKLELHHHLHHHELKAPIPLSFSNGSTLKKHTLHHQQELHTFYRECLKNHAASLGGHALDGCGEFLPSPSSNPSVPSSLTCAACGCHRNFHRRLTLPSKLNYDEDLEDDEDEENDGEPDHVSSAPRMLMALSAGVPRKRFRTRFSPDQKARMHDLSERLGWRLHKRDEKLVEDSCRDIGVEKGVFKVWMHNNKHNLFSARRQAASDTPQLNAANGSSTPPSLVPLPPPPPPPSQPDSDSSLLSR